MRFGKKTRKPGRGSVVAIPLPDGGYGYGRMLSTSYVQLREFFSNEQEASPETVVASRIIATVFVSQYETDEWAEIGVVEPTVAELSERVEYQHQDIVSGQMFIRWRTIEPSAWGEETAAWDQCGHLEPHAVWSAACHASRLSDLRAGREPEVLKRYARDPDAARSYEAGQPRPPRNSRELLGQLDAESSSKDTPVFAVAETAGVELQSPPYARIVRDDDEYSLTLTCGGLPADAAVIERHHEPNGYFWERALAFAEPELVQDLDLDSEAGAFFAVGSKRTLKAARSTLERLVATPTEIAALIERADREGFVFDD